MAATKRDVPDPPVWDDGDAAEHPVWDDGDPLEHPVWDDGDPLEHPVWDDDDALDHPVWDDGDALDLPELAGTIRADVCVVGLGGAGLSAVGTLLDAGVSVVGVDAGRVGGGASGRNGGFLLAGTADFHHRAVGALGRRRAAALYRSTLDEMDRMAARTPQAVRRLGSLRIAVDDAEADDCAAHLRALQADGFPGQAYDGPEGRGLLLPKDGSLDPLRRCRVLAAEARARGAALHERSPVTSIHVSGVTTPRGRVSAGGVVVAVDGGLETLLPELTGRVRTARAQMLATAPVSAPVASRPVYTRWGYDYWQQLPDGRVALGGCRDRGGPAEWTTEARASAEVQRHLERLLRERLRVHAAITHRWAGVIGFTADRLPVLAEVRPRVVAAGGYSGTGNVLGSLCGAEAANWVVGRPGELARLLAG